MHSDRPYIGVLLMVLFCVLAPLGDAIAKVLSATYPIFMLVFIRFSAQATILSGIALLRKIPMNPEKHILKWIVLRVLAHICGVFLMFNALRLMPLADAIAIVYILPFILLIAGHLFFNEEIGPMRIGATIIGFIGTLFIVQPAFAEIGWAATLPLFVAFAFAAYVLITRKIAKSMDPIALQGVSGLIALPCLGMIAIATLLSETNFDLWQKIQPNNIWLLAALGILGALSKLIMTWSLRLAPTATLAPIQYLELPIAAFFGWYIFETLPNNMATVGILVITSSGLFIIWRERSNSAQ